MADLAGVVTWIVDRLLFALEWAARLLLGPERDKARIRWLAATFVLATAWALLAYIHAKVDIARVFEPGVIGAQVHFVACTYKNAITSDPAKFDRVNRCYAPEIARSYTRSPLIFELPFQLLFAPNIFRHVLLVLFAIWLAYKVVAEYMRGLYNLPDTSCAEHYLLQTALVNRYNVMRIAECKVEQADMRLPIYLIGGPGLVRVNAENVALFEKMEGAPRVVGPTIETRYKLAILDGFERLRSIIDLRDQRDNFDIPGRSQDGIRISAKDIQAVYSIFRDDQDPTYERPYPFKNPEAVQDLVYEQGLGPWNITVGVQIRAELWSFYEKHPLNEFLSLIEDPEIRTINKREDELAAVSRRLSGEGEPAPSGDDPNKPLSVGGLKFVPRPDITQGFYESSKQFGKAKGTQINWIGVGTWQFPTQLVRTRHRDAWQISHDNVVKSKSVVLNTFRKQTRLYELQRLIQSVPITTYRTLKQENKPVEDLMRAMVLAYHHQLNEAYQDYQREIEINTQRLDDLRRQPPSSENQEEINSIGQKNRDLTNESEQIRRVLRYLSRFTARWVGEDDKT